MSIVLLYMSALFIHIFLYPPAKEIKFPLLSIVKFLYGGVLMNKEQLEQVKKGVSLIETLAKEKTNALLYTIEDRCFSDSLENYFYPVSVANYDGTVYKCHHELANEVLSKDDIIESMIDLKFEILGLFVDQKRYFTISFSQELQEVINSLDEDLAEEIDSLEDEDL
ncbi:MAG: hypothetical protein MR346_09345 [Clostridium sp.]|nr:hypothetical protein [Clostridium sp.]